MRTHYAKSILPVIIKRFGCNELQFGFSSLSHHRFYANRNDAAPSFMRRYQ